MSTSTQPAQAAAARCSSCNYWNAQASSDQGQCRRHAPQTVVFNVDAGVKFESRFPETKAADWCGDYSANR
ncbi:MAG TPA: hypothetical protein PLN52_02105 [Opitutaceae bacterium]|nr:hypothetical protein [Opitutaceae bacterium]